MWGEAGTLMQHLNRTFGKSHFLIIQKYIITRYGIYTVSLNVCIDMLNLNDNKINCIEITFSSGALDSTGELTCVKY